MSTPPPRPLGPFRALDYEFEIEAEDPSLRAWVERAFGALACADAGEMADRVSITVKADGPGTWSVEIGGVPLVRQSPASRILPRLTVDLNRRAVDSTAEHIVLHAGVVGDGAGAVLLVGPSGSGKSTMVATAARNGRPYGGDEHAAIRFDDQLVDPVPKPLALKTGSARLFEEHRSNEPAGGDFFGEQLLLAPPDLAGGILVGPQPVSLIVLPTHEPHAAVSIEQLRPASALMALRENAFNFPLDPTAAVRSLARIVRATLVLRVRFGDAASAWAAIDAHREW
jgi:hypothetical protein